MKIAIPVNNESLESGVCQSFGRAPYFLIYDLDSKESVFLENRAAINQGGAGVKAAQSIVDSKVSALLTPRCGDNAADIFQIANVKIYKTMNESISDNIKAFGENKLSILKDIHAGRHNHGGK